MKPQGTRVRIRGKTLRLPSNREGYVNELFARMVKRRTPISVNVRYIGPRRVWVVEIVTKAELPYYLSPEEAQYLRRIMTLSGMPPASTLALGIAAESAYENNASGVLPGEYLAEGKP